MERNVDEGTGTWVEVAYAYMGVNDHERALNYLEKAPDQRPPGNHLTAYVGVMPPFDPIRDHPRFQEVLKRLGLG